MGNNFRNFALGFLEALNKRQEEQRQIQQWVIQKALASRFNTLIRPQTQPKHGMLALRGPGVKRISHPTPKFIRRTPPILYPLLRGDYTHKLARAYAEKDFKKMNFIGAEINKYNRTVPAHSKIIIPQDQVIRLGRSYEFSQQNKLRNVPIRLR